MNRCIRAASSASFALVAAFTLASALTPSATHAAAAAELVSCVQVTADAAPLGMSVNFQNTCDYEIRCELAWNLRCEGAQPGEIKDRKRQSFNLQRGRQRAVFASGERCGDDPWEIVDESWECVQAR